MAVAVSILVFLSVASAAPAAGAAEDDVEALLAADDACFAGEEDCGVSLRQLRLEAAQERVVPSLVELKSDASGTGAELLQAEVLRDAGFSLAEAAAIAAEQQALRPPYEGGYFYDMDHCYPVSDYPVSVVYTCNNDGFRQKLYHGHNCSGSPAVTLGGKDPYYYKSVVWTCVWHMPDCALSWKMPFSYDCVRATRDTDNVKVSDYGGLLEVREHVAGTSVAVSEAVAESSAVSLNAAAEKQLVLASGPLQHVYRVDTCIPLKILGDFSLQYTCKDDIFTQHTYENADCTGKSAIDLGGRSPWHFAIATWTCLEGAEECAEVDATTCVVGSRERLPGIDDVIENASHPSDA